MIRILLLFIALTLAWVGLLWFGIAPDFATWSIPAMAGAHAVPPLLLTGGIVVFRRVRLRRAQEAALLREQAAAAEAAAKLEAARQQHQAEVARLQKHCDCRAVAMAQISRLPLTPESFDLDVDGLALSEWDENAIDAETPMLEHLRPGIAEALAGVYGHVAASARFPVYLVPPAGVVGEELFALVREVHQSLCDELALPPQPAPACYFLSTGDSVANSLIALFENGLQGAVVLAFDSPRLLAADEVDAEASVNDAMKWLGVPGQGVFALFVSAPDMLSSLAETPAYQGDGEQVDALTPYWERRLPGEGHAAFWQTLTAPEREVLAETPVIARIHRAHAVSLQGLNNRSRDTVLAIQPVLEKSRLSARLLDAPFQASEAPAAAEEPDPLACSWLVHNAGGVDRSGHRLATLGLALINQGLEVDPIHAGTNLVAQAGDLGQARSVGLLAMAVARAAATGKAALAAEYQGDDHLALYFAVAEGA